jgi:hypothetical protein
LKSLFQPLFEIDKELSILGRVRDVDEDANIVISEDVALVFPVAFDDLGL